MSPEYLQETFEDFSKPNALDQHPPCTAAIILAQLAFVMTHCDPNDIDAFFAMSEQFCLSGVSHPFWCNCPLTKLSHFLTPEGLHHWLREFWDRCVQLLGDVELDFQFLILPPITSLHHFSTRPNERYYTTLLLSLQAPQTHSLSLQSIQSTLVEFHDHKHAVLDGGLRCGPTTGVPLDHWQIPKLELMLSVVHSIEQVGSLLQWLADTTEHAHIKVVKDPASRMNNQNYDSQICRYLNHAEKCQQFNTMIQIQTRKLATTMILVLARTTGMS
ncbi:hypothetical protein V8E55_008499 [Tylopilus felleus]